MIETLKEEFKPVITKKYDNEYGDESKLSALLNSSDNQISEARIKVISYLFEYYSKSLKFSVENLLEEIETVVTESYGFGSGHKSMRKQPPIFETVRTLIQRTR